MANLVEFMKIIEALKPLVREHHYSLVVAHRAVHTAKSGVKEDIAVLCEDIQASFWQTMAAHFKTEEETVFAPLMLHSSAVRALCLQLTKQHQQLKKLSETLQENPEKLMEFGLLLKTHTRLEDRELFPYVETLDTFQKQAILESSERHSK